MFHVGKASRLMTAYGGHASATHMHDKQLHLESRILHVIQALGQNSSDAYLSPQCAFPTKVNMLAFPFINNLLP